MSKKSESAESWSEHLKAWGASGLSQTEYCQQHGLKPFTFSYWKKKLRAPAGSGLVEIKPQAQPLQPPAPHAALLEVHISESFDLRLNLRLPGTLFGRLPGGDVSGR